MTLCAFNSKWHHRKCLCVSCLNTHLEHTIARTINKVRCEVVQHVHHHLLIHHIKRGAGQKKREKKRKFIPSILSNLVTSIIQRDSERRLLNNAFIDLITGSLLSHQHVEWYSLFMLIKFWASYEQRLPARCQTVLVFVMCPLETWWGGGGDLKTGTALLKSRMEETHRRRTAKSSARNWSRLTKCTILRSPPLFREWDFGINNCEVGRKRRKKNTKTWTYSPVKRDFRACVNMHIRRSHFFFFFFYCASSFILRENCVNKKPPLDERRLFEAF